MAAIDVYHQLATLLEHHVEARVPASTRERLALLLLGMIGAQSAAPARIAQAIQRLGLSTATVESIERRGRRIENDPAVDATLCFQPFAQDRLRWDHPQELHLLLDPTSQDDRVVMVTVALWYRGRVLPLVWAVWPANQPLVGARFWTRIAALLDAVAPLLPVGIPVIWLADRAFGTPAFLDLLTARGWHYVVRLQHQTRYRPRRGAEQAIRTCVRAPGSRMKGTGQVFKKYGWRTASVVVLWGRRHTSPLAIVSDLRPTWALLHLYRRRYPIEAGFRDYKSHGWHWEQGQVTVLAHLQRLLVGMAFATWLVLYAGTHVAARLLAIPPTGHRRTVSWMGKRSLFTLGLQWWLRQASTLTPEPLNWRFAQWDAPNWHTQCYFHAAKAFVFARPRPPVRP